MDCLRRIVLVARPGPGLRIVKFFTKPNCALLRIRDACRVG